MAMNLQMSPLGAVHLHQQQQHQLLYQQHQRHIQAALQHRYQHDADQHQLGGWPMLAAVAAGLHCGEQMMHLRQGPPLAEPATVELENNKLWQQFHAQTTEMIITKSGRRMFPSLQLSVSGLDRRAQYCFALELAPASERRHKYVGAQESNNNNVSVNNNESSSKCSARGWTTAGPAEPQPSLERRIYLHPDSPASGAHWMQHPVSFSKLKLTNNVVEEHSNVILTSMHKYIPRIRIVRCDNVSSIRDLYTNPSAQFSFRETEFIAVTAYQNESITKLKIDNNPFAKGFRESGQSSCKRKRSCSIGLDGKPRETSSSPLATPDSDRQQRVKREDEDASYLSTESESSGCLSCSDSEAGPSPSKRPRLASGSSLSRPESRCSSSCATPPASSSSSCSSASATIHQPVALRPRPNPQQQQQRPKLHRPWIDPEVEEATLRSEERQESSLDLTTDAVSEPTRLMHVAAHYQLVALELARMRHLQQQQQFAPIASPMQPVLPPQFALLDYSA